MRATNERLTILSQAEQSALYELPDFDEEQRQEYFSFTESEQSIIFNRSTISTQIYCALQMGYFKAKQIFFRVRWEEVDQVDITFILQQYFSGKAFNPKPINQYEHYTQCHLIADFFEYRIWSNDFKDEVQSQIAKIILRDVSPQFIVMELFAFLRDKKIIRPRYTALQIIIRDALNNERKRLKSLIDETISSKEKIALENLLLKKDILSALASLKQDAKNFKFRIMTSEREKLMLIKPLYQIAKKLIPKLSLSQQNIHYYANMIQYYSIYELRKKLITSQAYLYILCYLWLRYQQFNDNLIDAFCYHLKQFEQENKEKSKEAFYQHQKQEQNEQFLMRRFASCFIDENFSNDIRFGEVRKKAFKLILPEEELRNKLSILNNKPAKEIDFFWDSIDKLGNRFKHQLRPLAMILDFSSTISGCDLNLLI